MSEAKRKWWLISVSGYGKFGFFGTEAEAEEMRAHKAIWERGASRKTAIPAIHHAAKEAIQLTKWELERGYELGERELASIGRTAIKKARQ